MGTIYELLARAAALREETALNSISPERAGGIMYDTIMAINELWLQQGSALVISKIYTSVSAMEADDEPVSDITGQPLRAGQIVVIASSDSDNGSVYRFGGISEGASVWALVGLIGNITPVDALDSDSTQLPLAAHQGKVLDGKISQLGQKVDGLVQPLEIEDADFSIEDENYKAIVVFRNGHIVTKNFDSEKAPSIKDTNSDFEVTDNNGNAILVINNGHVIAGKFNSRLLLQKVLDIDFQKYIEPIGYYAADNTKPQNVGQKNCIGFATELCELRWTPIRPMPSSYYGFVSDGTEDTNVVAGRKYYSPDVEMVGIPYSNAGEYGRNIGSDVRIETFMTALKNPNSVLYTIDTRDIAPSSLTSCYYGNNCSSFTNLLQNIPVLCFGRNCFFGGNRILEFPKNVEGAQIGDIVYLQRTVKDSGHAIIIIGITKSDGIITSIKTSEENSRSAVIVDYTKEAFINAFFKGGRGYEYGELFRNNGIINLESYEVFDGENYVYSETIGLNLGNNTNYDKADSIPIEVTLLADVSFSLIKDGVNYGSYSHSDGVAGYGSTKIVTVNKALLDYGVYEVRPSSGASQYFSLTKSGNVSANKQKDGSIIVSTFGYSQNVTPYGVLFFSDTQYKTTRGMYEMNGNNIVQIPSNFLRMIDTYGDVSSVIVAYRNDYGTIYSQKVQIVNN